MFSSRKYSVTPVRPAAANSAPSHRFFSRRRTGRSRSSVSTPMEKRSTMSSTVVKERSSTLVAMNVLPQTRMQKKADR